MTIDELLKNYRESICSEFYKGTRFEILMKNFLLTYAPYRGKFSNVWLWKNFPYKNQFGGKDLGIDIVARTFDGEFYAVQCKFYNENSTIDMDAVSHFISFSDKPFNVDGVEIKFSARIWISTTENYSSNALEMMKNQSPAIQIINLENLRKAQVNWSLLNNGFFGEPAKISRNLRDYQISAIEKAYEHFQQHSRGQLIMACGTGKTFTSLKIAEKIFPTGKILFLVPSISLLSQTLEEWATYSENPINAVCICSDSTASNNADKITDVNLPLPATTDATKISDAMKKFSGDRMTVLFSTYQSLDKVIDAQKIFNADFDLIVCDEAHRTAGYSVENEKFFTQVHDNKNIRANKRLYMTATPRMFSSSAQDRKNESNLTLWSMDDEKIFGKEFFSISFKEAIDKGCLTDYKVLVLTIPERSLKKSLLDAIHDKNTTITVSDALKIVGCIQALSKQCDDYSKKLLADDLSLMHTAVAFFSKIEDSEKYRDLCEDVQLKYKADLSDEEKENLVNIEWDHVDGKMNSSIREPKISALKNTPREGNLCRVVSNVRCLSEGVDVPALDAVIFLAPKKSRVEIVQAVGRAMRTAKNKKFGYIIIPIVIPISQDPDKILSKGEFKEVWQIVNALRAHDERIDTWIEQIRMSKKSSAEKKKNNDETENNPTEGEGHLIVAGFDLGPILLFDELRDKIYARMVDFVGNPRYWTEWAEKIKVIVERHTRRIKEIISVKSPAQDAFYKFLADLQKNINPSVKADEAVDMLAQHFVTRPVFEALFDDESFAKNNPVSIAMQNILDELDKDGLSKENEIFQKLYDQVRDSCSGMNNSKSRQEIIIRLYNSFFKMALPLTAQKLGIVYTPVEVVDFILQSVNDVLKKNFGKTLSDENVHILDPFTGTGTFITRLLQSGLIDKNILPYKYENEIHANEIVLLAYYIAAVNIENIFNVEGKPYTPFNGICFTDTFQTFENDEKSDVQTTIAEFKNPLEKNSERIQQQVDTKIEIIIGNPPYSVGQKSANDNAQNVQYQKIQRRIAETYAAGTNSTNKNSLYDSYIKAFRWASDRIGESGVIGFVTNAGWIDGAAMDGMRNCFEKEFSEIYIFNLRGNQRTQGEISRKEGGKIFGSGSRAPIAITILVKGGNREQGIGNSSDTKISSLVPNPSSLIHYLDIGDYLSREEKLDKIKNLRTVLSEEFKIITPNEKGDWINQRGNEFENYIPLAPDKKFNAAAQSFFCTYSNGIKTNRDSWLYNFSKKELEKHITAYVDKAYEGIGEDEVPLRLDKVVGNKRHFRLIIPFNEDKIFDCIYRPFCKTSFYNDRSLIERVYQMPKLFPNKDEKNLLICVTGIGSSKNFSVLMTDKITDVQFQFNGQYFPLYWYEDGVQGNLFEKSKVRRDGISDWIENLVAKKYGLSEYLKLGEKSFCIAKNALKEEIFYYVYGFLHLPSYREKFSAELKKSLPRIFLVDDAKKFWKLVKAGRELAEIHLHYEKFSAPPEVEIIGEESGKFAVKKLRLSKDKTTLIYNEFIMIKNIPPRSFDYVVNGRSPLEWIIDRYQVKVDSASGIENNPNDWCAEHDNPRYILDLILSCITVSLKTLDIVKNLPTVEF